MLLQTRWMNLTDSDRKRITIIKAWITLTRSAKDWEVSSVQLSYLIIRQRFVWDTHAAVFQENLDVTKSYRFTVSSIQAFSCRLILQRMTYAMWYLLLCLLTKHSVTVKILGCFWPGVISWCFSMVVMWLRVTRCSIDKIETHIFTVRDVEVIFHLAKSKNKRGNTKNSVKISKRPPTQTRLWLDLKVASGRILATVATLMEIYVTMTSTLRGRLRARRRQKYPKLWVLISFMYCRFKKKKSVLSHLKAATVLRSKLH